MFTQVHCFAFGIWPSPQPYAIIRAHHSLVEDFSRFLQRDLPNLVYGPGPREYALSSHPPNHGFQQFSPSPLPNSGFQRLGPPQQPFILGLPSTLPPQSFSGAQPTFGPSEFSHQPASFYGPPPLYMGSSLPPYHQAVAPLGPRPGPPTFIPQSELQLPTSPATGYLPPQSSSSAVALPNSPSSTVDSLPSANQPTSHTVPSISSTSSQASSMPTTVVPATNTPALIQTENDLSLQTSSTESASPTVEQSTAGTDAASTVSNESLQSTTPFANEEIINNAV